MSEARVTCACGARLDVEGMALFVSEEVRSFYRAHEECRERPPPWPADVEIARQAAAYFPELAALRKVAEAAKGFV